MAKPNVLLIGAPKAATTSLNAMLARHPDVCTAAGKEPHFFSHDECYARGMPWYEAQFAHGRTRPAIIDSSTSYARVASFPRTIRRVMQHVPDARIIYAVRHPLHRMESAYVEWMASDEPRNYPSVNEAVRQNIELIDASSYWKQISVYRKHFPDTRIKIVFFDDYTSDPRKVLVELFAFIGVAPNEHISFFNMPRLSRASRIERMRRNGNTTPVNTVWRPKDRQWAIEQLGDDPRRFLEWCGKPADYWAF